jgi:hypothetical protein
VWEGARRETVEDAGFEVGLAADGEGDEIVVGGEEGCGDVGPGRGGVGGGGDEFAVDAIVRARGEIGFVGEG